MKQQATVIIVQGPDEDLSVYISNKASGQEIFEDLKQQAILDAQQLLNDDYDDFQDYVDSIKNATNIQELMDALEQDGDVSIYTKSPEDPKTLYHLDPEFPRDIYQSQYNS